MKWRIPTLDAMVWTALGVAVLIAGVFVYWLFGNKPIDIKNAPPQQLTAARSPLTGLECPNTTRRPVAVMISSDKEARPLSGLSKADVVFEMPVTPNGITRMMAVFQCGDDPTEVGSIRSAREDFIPLSQGFNALLAHWGGEHEALAHLNGGVTTNVDAMKFEGSTFYRKRGVPGPHDGFSTLQLIRDRANKLGYTASASIPAWPHLKEAAPEKNLASTVDRATVPWPQGMGIEFRYDSASNTYARWRNGTPEIDATTKTQVSVSVVIVMQTTSAFLRDQYISVQTVGQGIATIYQDGRRIQAIWKKPSAKEPLIFTDSAGKAVPLTPGHLWVAIDAPLPLVP